MIINNLLISHENAVFAAEHWHARKKRRIGEGGVRIIYPISLFPR